MVCRSASAWRCLAGSKARPSGFSRCCPMARTTRDRCGKPRCSVPRRNLKMSASSSTTTSGRAPPRPHKRDGHVVGPLAEAMQNPPNGSGKPVALIAHTVKGKGVSFMEDDNNWHYRAPTAEEVVKAHKELGLA